MKLWQSGLSFLRGTVQLSSEQEKGRCNRLIRSGAKPTAVAVASGNTLPLPHWRALGMWFPEHRPVLSVFACLSGQFQASLFPSYSPSCFISPSPFSFRPMFITECSVELLFLSIDFIECSLLSAILFRLQVKKKKKKLLHATPLGQSTHTRKCRGVTPNSIDFSQKRQGFLLYSKIQDSVRRLGYNDSTLTCSCYPTWLRFSN